MIKTTEDLTHFFDLMGGPIIANNFMPGDVELNIKQNQALKRIHVQISEKYSVPLSLTELFALTCSEILKSLAYWFRSGSESD